MTPCSLAVMAVSVRPAGSDMLRWRRRWKQCVCFLALAIVVTYVLHSTSVLTLLPGPPRLAPLFHLPPGRVPGEAGGEERRGQIQPVIKLYDPFSRDHGDRVGLKAFHKFDCVRAIEGFPVAVEKNVPPVAILSDQGFSERLQDCGSFVERYGYNRYPPVTEEESKFPLAFSILLYKEVWQLHLLLRAIYRPHNSYCLHVDGHAAQAVFQASWRLAACLPNVFLATRRENITYAGFSRLQADLNCMEDHWSRSASQPVPWQYLINLPSQDFPLKTNSELVKILSIYNGANDIEGITNIRRMMKHRFTFKHVYRKVQGSSGRLRVVRTEEKLEAPPHNITVVKGSAYGVFSRRFVQYVLQDPRARDLLQWCRAVESPDEYYWATLNHNPHLRVPGGYTGEAEKKPWLAVYASWPPRDLCVSHKSVRGVCIFGVRDLPQLIQRQELFANKFYLDFQPQTLHCLDQWLFNKTRAALPFNSFPYRQLPFIIKP